MNSNDEITPEMALIWLAAACAEFVTVDDWQRWADSKIEQFDKVPYWVLELSTASNLNELLILTQEATYQLDLQRPGARKYGRELVGFIFIRYQLGKISIHRLLELAGLVTDNGCGYGWGPESYYEILNDLEAEKKSLKEADLEIREMLADVGSTTVKKWNEMVPDYPITLPG